MIAATPSENTVTRPSARYWNSEYRTTSARPGDDRAVEQDGELVLRGRQVVQPRRALAEGGRAVAVEGETHLPHVRGGAVDARLQAGAGVRDLRAADLDRAEHVLDAAVALAGDDRLLRVVPAALQGGGVGAVLLGELLLQRRRDLREVAGVRRRRGRRGRARGRRPARGRRRARRRGSGQGLGE